MPSLVTLLRWWEIKKCLRNVGCLPYRFQSTKERNICDTLWEPKYQPHALVTLLRWWEINKCLRNVGCLPYRFQNTKERNICDTLWEPKYQPQALVTLLRWWEIKKCLRNVGCLPYRFQSTKERNICDTLWETKYQPQALVSRTFLSPFNKHAYGRGGTWGLELDRIFRFILHPLQPQWPSVLYITKDEGCKFVSFFLWCFCAYFAPLCMNFRVVLCFKDVGRRVCRNVRRF